MKKTIIIIIILGLILAGGFLGFWYYRDQIFSKEILKVEILGPENANMADEITYTVKYKNNGNFVLENPKLIFNLPENSLTEDGKTRLTQDLKDIYPGDQNFVNFPVRLLGKEGELKVVNAWLSYTPHNLSARYESHTTFTTKIVTVPITFSFDAPLKVEKDKEVAYAINYFSNIDYPLENLSIKIDPVNGFNIESSDPASLDNAEWKLATLEKAEGGKINVKGVASAPAGSRVSLVARLGMWRDGNFVVIKEATQDIELISPLLFISQQINGDFNYVASPGEKLHYKIFFRNISQSPFDDLFIMSHLSGAAVDLSTLSSAQGQIRAGEQLIIFDGKQIPKLNHLLPQQEVSVEFDVKLKNAWSPTDSEKNNSVIKNEINASSINQTFENKVNSLLMATQDAVFQNYQNNMALYKITWKIKNYSNDVKNVKVKTLLPEGANFGDNISPSDQASHFSLDSNSGQMIWLLGDALAGTGVTDGERSLSFQVLIDPNLPAQAVLSNFMGSTTISGEDQFTGKVISNKALFTINN